MRSWRAVGWYIEDAAGGRVALPDPLILVNAENGARRRGPDGIDGLMSSHDMAWELARGIAGALGPDVLDRLESGDESLDLVAELRRLLAQTFEAAEALNRPPWVPADAVPAPESRAW